MTDAPRSQKQCEKLLLDLERWWIKEGKDSKVLKASLTNAFLAGGKDMSGYSNSDRFILEPDKLSRPVSSESDRPVSRGKTPPIGLPKRKVPLQRSALAPPESS